MKHITATLIALTASLVSAAALADGITVRRGQFTDRVERGAPAAAESEVPSSGRVVYWLEASNRGGPSQLTLVWRVGGREVTRQTLDVGRAPRWRTWGVLARRGRGVVEVQVLDPAGGVIHTDRLE